LSAPSDIVILGGGPGGYATALRAAARGMSVKMVAELKEVGGTCLHLGCVPSKALLHAASVQAEYQRLTHQEGTSAAVGLTPDHLMRLRDSVVGRLHGGLTDLLRSRGIEVVDARGRVSGPGTVEAAGELVEGRAVVVATGSVPRHLPNLDVDGEVVVTSDHALTLHRIPEAPVVVGGGAIGVEFASMWSDLGASVTVLEVMDRLLPLEDESSSAFLQRSFKRRGIDVKVSSTVERLERRGDRAVLHLHDGTTVESDLVLVAVGRVPNTGGSGADEMGLVDARGFVEVTPDGRTRVPGVWAVGDVVPTLALAHAAFAEGFVVADAVAGHPSPPVDYEMVPRVTYCHPEVASVGLTEAQARQRYSDVAVVTTSMAGNARVVIEDGAGQLKLVTRADGELVGVHIVGPMATELIAEATLATTWGALVEEAAAVVHAHPTVSESFREAALSAAGLPFHAHAPSSRRREPAAG
jgi:dihydrolipoamide dehydrogenase